MGHAMRLHLKKLIVMPLKLSINERPPEISEGRFLSEYVCSHRYNSCSGMSGVIAKPPRCGATGFTAACTGVGFSGGGGVSLFLPFPRLNSFRYLARVGAFTSMPFSCSFSAISCMSKPRFFMRSRVGARAKTVSFTLRVRLPARVTFSGWSLASSILISLTWAVVIFMSISPIFMRGNTSRPRLCVSAFGGRAAWSPTLRAVKYSGLYLWPGQRCDAASSKTARALVML